LKSWLQVYQCFADHLWHSKYNQR